MSLSFSLFPSLITVHCCLFPCEKLNCSFALSKCQLLGYIKRQGEARAIFDGIFACDHYLYNFSDRNSMINISYQDVCEIANEYRCKIHSSKLTESNICIKTFAQINIHLWSPIHAIISLTSVHSLSAERKLLAITIPINHSLL